MNSFKESTVKAIKVKRIKQKNNSSSKKQHNNQIFKAYYENEQFFGVKYIDEEENNLSNSHVKYKQDILDPNQSKDDSMINSLIIKFSNKKTNKNRSSLVKIEEESTEVKSTTKETPLSSNNNTLISKTSQSRKNQQKDNNINEYKQSHRKSKSEMFTFEDHSWALNILESQSKKDSEGVNLNKKYESRGFFSKFLNPFQCNTRDNGE